MLSEIEQMHLRLQSQKEMLQSSKGIMKLSDCKMNSRKFELKTSDYRKDCLNSYLQLLVSEK